MGLSLPQRLSNGSVTVLVAGNVLRVLGYVG